MRPFMTLAAALLLSFSASPVQAEASAETGLRVCNEGTTLLSVAAFHASAFGDMGSLEGWQDAYPGRCTTLTLYPGTIASVVFATIEDGRVVPYALPRTVIPAGFVARSGSRQNVEQVSGPSVASRLCVPSDGTHLGYALPMKKAQRCGADQTAIPVAFGTIGREGRLFSVVLSPGSNPTGRDRMSPADRAEYERLERELIGVTVENIELIEELDAMAEVCGRAMTSAGAKRQCLRYDVPSLRRQAARLAVRDSTINARMKAIRDTYGLTREDLLGQAR